MIYNDKFVWLHFPKCAGTKVEELFSKYLFNQKGLHLDLIGPEKDSTIAWHDNVSARESRDSTFKLGDRIVICSIRELPSWLISRFCYEAKRSPQLAHNPETLLEGKFLEAKGYLNNADWYMKRYLPKDILSSGKVRFIRTEFFEEDFKAAFSDLIDISNIPNNEYQKKTKNKSKDCIPTSTRKQMEISKDEIYRLCPYWRDVVKMAY